MKTRVQFYRYVCLSGNAYSLCFIYNRDGSLRQCFFIN